MDCNEDDMFALALTKELLGEEAHNLYQMLLSGIIEASRRCKTTQDRRGMALVLSALARGSLQAIANLELSENEKN